MPNHMEIEINPRDRGDEKSKTWKEKKIFWRYYIRSL